MKVPAIILAALVSPLFAESKEAAASLLRLEELRTKSETITRTSSQQEVASIMGEPEVKGTGGWGDMEKEVWHYLAYTDDSIHRSFSVSFDPKAGCAVSPVEVSRKEVEKSPLEVMTGTVMEVHPEYPGNGSNGFLCHVRFHREDRDFTIGVAVETLDRVKGTPEVGVSIRMEHRVRDMNYIFVGVTRLYLESMVFTANGGPVGPPESGSPSN